LPQGNPGSIWIHLLWIQIQLLYHGAGLCGERFIRFDDIEITNVEPCAFQRQVRAELLNGTLTDAYRMANPRFRRPSGFAQAVH
jgi:hypothetical protein